MPLLVAIATALVATVFVIALRMPAPFPGASIAFAAALAFGATLAILMAAPARALWSDTERLSHAFGLRHNMSDNRSALVLHAIATAHSRADAMRDAAKDFAEELGTRTNAMADRIDGIAKKVFYQPDALSGHRAALIRSELIEEALTTHAELRRGTAEGPQVDESRAKIHAALDALDAAFDEAEAREADKLLTQVDTASATAELLLNRGRAR